MNDRFALYILVAPFLFVPGVIDMFFFKRETPASILQAAVREKQ